MPNAYPPQTWTVTIQGPVYPDPGRVKIVDQGLPLVEEVRQMIWARDLLDIAIDEGLHRLASR